MKRIAFIVIALLISAKVSSSEWYPDWQSATFPDRNAKIFVAQHPDPSMEGLPVIFVYFEYKEPRPAQYFRQELYIGEIQEWVVNCTENSASISTIRYTNNIYPNEIRRAVLVHPFGIEAPPAKEVENVCKLLT